MFYIRRRDEDGAHFAMIYDNDLHGWTSEPDDMASCWNTREEAEAILNLNEPNLNRSWGSITGKAHVWERKAR